MSNTDRYQDRYTNRQGNAVIVFRSPSFEVVSIEINGSGSNRAFQAQLKAAHKRADARTEVLKAEGRARFNEALSRSSAALWR